MSETTLARIKKISLVIFSSLASVFLVQLIIWVISMSTEAKEILSAILFPISTFWPHAPGESMGYFIPFLAPIAAPLILTVSLSKEIVRATGERHSLTLMRITLVIALIILVLEAVIVIKNYLYFFLFWENTQLLFLLVIFFIYYLIIYYVWFSVLYIIQKVIYNKMNGVSEPIISLKVFLLNRIFTYNFLILGAFCSVPLIFPAYTILHFIAPLA